MQLVYREPVLCVCIPKNLMSDQSSLVFYDSANLPALPGVAESCFSMPKRYATVFSFTSGKKVLIILLKLVTTQRVLIILLKIVTTQRINCEFMQNNLN